MLLTIDDEEMLRECERAIDGPGGFDVRATTRMSNAAQLPALERFIETIA